MALGQDIYNALEELGKISAPGKGVTRLYLTEEHKRAIPVLEKMMQDAGLKTHVDAIGNVVGEYTSPSPDAPTLLLGSHQDTVRSGGKYDGALGVVLPIFCMKELLQQGELPCNVRVYAFGQEEAVRYFGLYLASKSVVGTFDPAYLDAVDQDGITMRDALISFGLPGDDFKSCQYEGPADAYLEVHIEQGPVLEKEGLAVGIVSGIQALSRCEITIKGVAGHAGTVPMRYRNDPVRAMSHVITEIMDYAESKEGLVITVGVVKVSPGSINVIPAEAFFTVDIRAPKIETVRQGVIDMEAIVKKACEARPKLSYDYEELWYFEETPCNDWVIDQLAESMERSEQKVFKVFSGAGHDAQEMKNLTSVGMLFVRCKEGISHNPEESVSAEDIGAAAAVVKDFIAHFSKKK